MNSGQIQLGIESALAGGSISLFCNGEELAQWTGTDEVSRAEELLPSIDRVIRDNSLTPSEISKIIVSTGPGSFTGIRVGIATVLGLRASLGVRCVGITALEALAESIGPQASVIAAVPMGRETICFQKFSNGVPTTSPQLTAATLFGQLLARESGTLIAHAKVFNSADNKPITGPKFLDAGSNIASVLCRVSGSRFESQSILPLFVDRKAASNL
jgi:tRNA threonylcarbamoyl adenosine modification protein YeaZ